MLGIAHPFIASPDQIISRPGRLNPLPGSPRNLNVIRHRTTDFEVWGVVKEHPEMTLTFLSQVKSPTCDTEGRGFEEDSLSDTSSLKSRVPNLGPTRQESRRYLKRKKREQSFR